MAVVKKGKKKVVTSRKVSLRAPKGRGNLMLRRHPVPSICHSEPKAKNLEPSRDPSSQAPQDDTARIRLLPIKGGQASPRNDRWGFARIRIVKYIGIGSLFVVALALAITSGVFQNVAAPGGQLSYHSSTSSADAATTTDATQGAFDAGTRTRTAWNTDHEELITTVAASLELPANARKDEFVDMTGNVGLWRLNESSGTIADASGKGGNGTYNGTLYSQTGKLNTAIGFDGSDDKVQVNSVFGLGNTNVTIATWVYLADTSRKGGFVKVGASNGYSIGVGSTTHDANGNNLILLYENVRWINTGAAIGTGWHHVAMTIDGSGVPTAFIDGVSKGSFTGTNANAPTTQTDIGGNNPSASPRFFNGTMDETAIFNRALSAGEIAEIYETYEGSFVSSVKDATSAATWAKLNWTPQAPYGKELPNNATTETAYSTGNANMSGNVGLWHMNETYGTIVDSSGQGNNGTPTAITYAAAGRLNTGLSLNGTSSYIAVTDNANLTFGSAATFTLEGWYNLSATSSRRELFARRNTGGTSNYALRVDAGKLVFEYYSSSWHALSTNSAIISTATWYHIAATVTFSNGATVSAVTFYVTPLAGPTTSYSSGSLATWTSGNGVGVPITSGTFNVNMGRDPYVGNAFFGGTMDEVAIYNRILTSTELLDHYKRGALRIKYQVRSCAASCSGESFVGPNGSTTDYYSELQNSTIATPGIALQSVPTNQYFQYKAFFETDNASYTPGLTSVAVDYTTATMTRDDTQAEFDAGLRNHTLWATATEFPDSASTNGYVSMANNVGLWHLNESSGTIADSSGQSHNGTVTGATYSASGKLNTALSFDGSGDYIDTGTTLGVSGGFSVASWVYLNSNSITNYARAVVARGQWGAAAADGDFALELKTSTNSQTGTGRWVLEVDTTAGAASRAIETVDAPLSQWSHIVGVWDGSNIRMYRDGVLQATVAYAGTFPSNARNGYIGAYPSGPADTTLNGKIDETAVFSRALSASEVAEIYSRQTGNYTNTEALATVDSDQELPASAGNDGYVNMTGNVGLWHMNETSGTIADSSGQNNTGTASNVTYSASGKINTALSFNGSSSNINAGDINAVDGATRLTVMSWVKWGGAVGGLSAAREFHRKDAVYAFGGGWTARKATLLVNNGAWFDSGDSTTNIDDGIWHFIVGVYDGTFLRLYVDGAQESSRNIGSITLSSNANAVMIGSTAGTSEFWNGSLDEVAVFNRALTASEVTEIYARQMGGYMNRGEYTSAVANIGGATTAMQALEWVPQAPYGKELPNNGYSETVYPSGNANMTGNVGLWHMNEPSWGGATGEVADSSGNSNNGTRAGNATTTASGKLNSGGTFDGVNDNVTIVDNNTLDLTGAFTTMLWVKTNTTGAIQGLISKLSGSPYDGWAFRIESTNKLGVYLKTWVSGTKNVADLTWHHVVFVYNGNGTGQFYADGVADGSLQSGLTTPTNTTQSVYIGEQSWDGGGDANATLDEIAVFNRALSATEVLDFYKRGALRIKYQARSCDDSSCTGETLVGPDGTASTYYTELNNTTSFTPIVRPNAVENSYFQYKAFLETDNGAYSPALKSVTTAGFEVPWWDGNYANRKKITIVNGYTGSLPTAYSASTTFDHAALVTAGKALASGNDVRVVYWDGANATQLDRMLDDAASWNNSATKIWFATQRPVSPSAADAGYYLYYGYSSASSPPATWANVYSFYDNFDDGDATGWTTTGGTWAVTSQQYRETSGGGWWYSKYLVTNTNFVMQAKVNMSNGTGGAAGLIFRSNRTPVANPSKMYHLDTYGQNLRLFTNINGTYTQIGSSAATTFATNTWYTIKVEALGTSIKTYVDGVLKQNATDATIDVGGGVGLASYSTQNYFDNIVVRKYVGVDPTTSLGTEAAGTVSIAGTVYTDEGSTVMTTQRTIRLKVNGAGDFSATVAANGTYTISPISPKPSAGDVLTVYLDEASEKAVLVTRSAGSSIAGANLYQNRVIVRHEDGGPITNANLDQWDNGNDADIRFAVTSSNLTVSNTAKLYIWAGKTFTPGGTVTTSPGSAPGGDVFIGSGSTLSVAANAVSVGGSWDNNGTYTISSGQTTTFTATSTGKTVEVGGATYQNVVFNGTGGGWTVQTDALTIAGDYTLTAANDVTLAVDMTVTGNATLSSATAWTLASGKTLTVQGTFANSIPAATTWTGSTLYLTSGTSYTIGAKTQAAETYGTVRLSPGTNIRWWNSSAGTVTID